MAIPVYSIYIDGKIQNVFPKSGTKTTNRKEAEGMYNSMRLVSCSDGAKLELRVSSRGLEKTLKEETIRISGVIAETAQTPEYHYDSFEPNEKELFLGLIRELYETGFSVSEIAEITGKTYRVISYNLKKLLDTEEIESHGRGRPVDDANRRRKAVTIQMYEDNYDYLKETFGNVTSAVNDLIDRYRSEHGEKE